MARIRSIKPEIRTSYKVTSWPIEVRYFWVLLWGYCDDFGRGRDDPRLIVADTFPLDDAITAESVSVWMDRLEKEGVIVRYQVDGSAFFYVTNWAEHQRPSHPSKSSIPAPTSVSGEAREALANDSGDTRPRGGAGSREQGGGGEPPKFCRKHPEGSGGAPCGACGDARKLHQTWEATQRSPTPTPPRRHEARVAECPKHEGYPLLPACAACEREEARIAV